MRTLVIDEEGFVGLHLSDALIAGSDHVAA